MTRCIMRTTRPRAGARLRAAGLWTAALATSIVATTIAGPVNALTGGTVAPGTPTTQATVLIQRGTNPNDDGDTSDSVLVDWCTGTLVAPDLVLTAGHCLDHWEVKDRPHEPYRGTTSNDWERPDRFYPTDILPSSQLPTGRPNVIVAEDRRVDEANEFQTRATHYALPGDADVALLRLERPVPREAAIPVPVMTALPGAVADAQSWFRNNTGQFQAAGYGNANSLQTATVTGVQFPCPSAWSHKICGQLSPTGASANPGDSGGPLYLTDSSGVRRVIGDLQDTGPTHVASFFRGGSKDQVESTEIPNIGGWLDQFVNRRSGGAAYVWYDFIRDGSGNVIDAPLRRGGYTSNPSGLEPTVERTGAGVYRVRFEGLGNTAQPRIPLVTAGSWSHYCKVLNGWNPDRVDVGCFNDAGTPQDAFFSLVSDYSNPRDLWMRAPFLTSATATVRSVHGDVTVTHLGIIGSYRVSAPGWTGGAWRNVMVTAEGSGATRCHVVGWSASSAEVQCAAGTIRRNSGFTLAATSETDSSYAWGSDAVGTGCYSALPDYANTAGNGNVPTICRTSTGQYTVSFPGLPANQGGNIQVTAYGSTFNRCNRDGHGTDWVGVGCRTPAGASADTRFVVRYIDPLDVGRTVRVELDELVGTSSDDSGGLDMYGSLRFAAGATGSVNIPLVQNRLNRRFSPPLTLSARSQPGQQFVDVVLAVRDDDGSHVDVVDIVPNPSTTVTALRLRVDLVAHTVTMLDALRPIGGGLGAWWSDGCPPQPAGQCDPTGNMETARAAFKVHVADH